MTWEKEAKEINEKRNFADQMGGKKALELQFKKGRLPVRERINRILDSKSFNEIGKSAGFSEYNDNGSLKKFTPGNFILGFGKINKRPVIIGGEDFFFKRWITKCCRFKEKYLYRRTCAEIQGPFNSIA